MKKLWFYLVSIFQKSWNLILSSVNFYFSIKFVEKTLVIWHLKNSRMVLIGAERAEKIFEILFQKCSNFALKYTFKSDTNHKYFVKIFKKKTLERYFQSPKGRRRRRSFFRLFSRGGGGGGGGGALLRPWSTFCAPTF